MSEENPVTESSIQLNTTFTFTLENLGFDILSQSQMISRYKDGRPFSHMIELWLEYKFPLKYITGCKQYDHTNINDENVKYDQKTFTSGGCIFMPSNMIGEGRKFNKEIFEEKAKSLIYIIVSNVNFPEIKVKFVKGIDLIVHYPNGKIPFKDLNKFFN